MAPGSWPGWQRPHGDLWLLDSLTLWAVGTPGWGSPGQPPCFHPRCRSQPSRTEEVLKQETQGALSMTPTAAPCRHHVGLQLGSDGNESTGGPPGAPPSGVSPSACPAPIPGGRDTGPPSWRQARRLGVATRDDRERRARCAVERGLSQEKPRAELCNPPLPPGQFLPSTGKSPGYSLCCKTALGTSVTSWCP